MSNPYTLVFGQPPVEIVERSSQAERIISEFCQERPSNYLNLVTGIRGCGKTVFITRIAQRLAEKKDWIIVNLNPQRDLLKSLAGKLHGDRRMNQWFQEAEINLQLFGLEIGVTEAPAVEDIEDAVIRMLRSIQKHGRRVLITIDEATNSREIRAFASSYQIFLREGLPVFLLMTGLYNHIDRLRNADGMTFLERAPRTVLSPLSFTAMVERYEKTLGISQAAASVLAKTTKGYSFAFQTVGYFCYEYSGDIDRAFTEAKAYLKEFAYRKIRSELSDNDLKVLCAIARTKDGQISEARDILQYSSNQFNPYRDRLLKSGVIVSPGIGYVEIALPWFGEYILESFSEEES